MNAAIIDISSRFCGALLYLMFQLTMSFIKNVPGARSRFEIQYSEKSMGPTSAACLLVPAARGAGEVGGAKVSFKSRIRLTAYLENRLMELAIKLAVESGLGAVDSTEIHKKCGFQHKRC
jgi:hypothetical protein